MFPQIYNSDKTFKVTVSKFFLSLSLFKSSPVSMVTCGTNRHTLFCHHVRKCLIRLCVSSYVPHTMYHILSLMKFPGVCFTPYHPPILKLDQVGALILPPPSAILCNLNCIPGSQLLRLDPAPFSPSSVYYQQFGAHSRERNFILVFSHPSWPFFIFQYFLFFFFFGFVLVVVTFFFLSFVSFHYLLFSSTSTLPRILHSFFAANFNDRCTNNGAIFILLFTNIDDRCVEEICFKLLFLVMFKSE